MLKSWQACNGGGVSGIPKSEVDDPMLATDGHARLYHQQDELMDFKI